MEKQDGRSQGFNYQGEILRYKTKSYRRPKQPLSG